MKFEGDIYVVYPPSFKQQPLLLVSLDGLRAEYLQKWSPLVPVLDKLSWCPHIMDIFTCCRNRHLCQHLAAM